MSIFVTGDTHGKLEILSNTRMQKQFNRKMNENDSFIILGDFGCVWECGINKARDKEERYLDMFSESLKGKLFAVPGNHENYDRIHKLPTVTVNNAKCYEVRNNIFIVQTGECLILDDKKFLSIGGATSIDKEGRIEGISWWKDENPSYKEWCNVSDTIDKYGEFDYIISHTCSTEGLEATRIKQLLQRARLYPCPVTRSMDLIQDRLKFKRWFFGHFHENVISDRYVCLYNKVIEI